MTSSVSSSWDMQLSSEEKEEDGNRPTSSSLFRSSSASRLPVAQMEVGHPSLFATQLLTPEDADVSGRAHPRRPDPQEEGVAASDDFYHGERGGLRRRMHPGPPRGYPAVRSALPLPTASWIRSSRLFPTDVHRGNKKSGGFGLRRLILAMPVVGPFLFSMGSSTMSSLSFLFFWIFPSTCYFCCSLIWGAVCLTSLFSLVYSFLIPPSTCLYPIYFDYRPAHSSKYSGQGEVGRLDLAISFIQFSNQTWISSKNNRSHRSLTIPQTGSLAPPLVEDFEVDISLSFIQLGPAYVSTASRFTDRTTYSRNRENDIVHVTQPLPVEPVMFTIELQDSKSALIAKSSRPYFPKRRFFFLSQFVDALVDIPAILTIPVRILMAPLSYVSPLHFRQFYRWLSTSQNQRVDLIERFENAGTHPVDSVVLTMEPLLPIQSPAYLLFETKLYGFREVLRRRPLMCWAVFLLTVGWVPSILFFLGLLYMHASIHRKLVVEEDEDLSEDEEIAEGTQRNRGPVGTSLPKTQTKKEEDSRQEEQYEQNGYDEEDSSDLVSC